MILRAIFPAAIILGLIACKPDSGEAGAGSVAAPQEVPADSLTQVAWAVLCTNQLDHWGNTAFWEPEMEELCAYYVGQPGPDGDRVQFTDTLIWKVTDRGFIISELREQGKSRLNHTGLGRGAVVEPVKPNSPPSSIELAMLLRASAFNPGKTYSLPVFDQSRFGNEGWTSVEVMVKDPEPVSFQGATYECWALQLDYADGQKDWLWYERDYPNRLVRRVTSSQETHMLKAFRIH